MLEQDVIAFLKTVPPFQFLEDADLRRIAQSASAEFFPRGARIVERGKPSGYLHVIRKGGVKLSLPPDTESADGAKTATPVTGDGEIVLDYRGAGDLFGYLSAKSGEPSRTDVTAIEDAICLLVDAAALARAEAANPEFERFFLKAVYADFMDKALEELRKRNLAARSGESLLFTMPVLEVADRDFARAPADISIREAATRMTRAGRSALILINDDGGAQGILTDADFRSKVAAKGVSLDAPAREVMSSPVVSVEARESCLEAMLVMLRGGFHHALAVNKGQPAGLLSAGDLMLLQGQSPVAFMRKVESAASLEELQNVSLKTGELVGLLLDEGAKASVAAKITSALYERIIRRVLAFAQEATAARLGPAPLPWCFIIFGSEGRKEQIYRTDQDNALIWADPEDRLVTPETAEAWFGPFSEFVRDALVGAGFPPCPAGYMAENPRWRAPLKLWKKRFASWIAEPTAENVLSSLIFFDFRPVYGDFSLAEELREKLLTQASQTRPFLGFLAQALTRNRPPLGFFKSFLVETSGERKGSLNLKVKGLAPIVDLVRLFALERGVGAVSTLERIEALTEAGHGVVHSHGAELAAAFEFLLYLRAARHREAVDSGREPENWISPEALTPLERKSLKESFALIGDLQDVVRERYKEFMW